MEQSRSVFERTQVNLIGGWLIVGSKQGKKDPFDKQIFKGMEAQSLCADEFGMTHVSTRQGEVYYFAVADGIGSEPYGDVGAREAVAAALQLLVKSSEGAPLELCAMDDVLEGIHDRLQLVADERDIEVGVLGTTVLVGALHGATGRLICAAVGDAFIVTQGPKGTWSFPPFDDFEPSGGTYSIGDKGWRKVSHREVCPLPIDTAIAFTDGLRHVMFKVNRSGESREAITVFEEAIAVFRKGVLDAENGSRCRNVSTMLGTLRDERLMADDRTVLIFQRVRDLEAVMNPGGPLYCGATCRMAGEACSRSVRTGKSFDAPGGRRTATAERLGPFRRSGRRRARPWLSHAQRTSPADHPKRPPVEQPSRVHNSL